MSIAEIVNTWSRERLGCWPLAGHTEAYNQVAEALPELISRLEAAAAPPSAPPKSAKAAQPAPAEPTDVPTDTAA